MTTTFTVICKVCEGSRVDRERSQVDGPDGGLQLPYVAATWEKIAAQTVRAAEAQGRMIGLLTRTCAGNGPSLSAFRSASSRRTTAGPGSRGDLGVALDQPGHGTTSAKVHP